MATPNLGWIYYRHNWHLPEYNKDPYFFYKKEEKQPHEQELKIIKRHFDSVLRVIQGKDQVTLQAKRVLKVSNEPVDHIELITLYPGLLIGSGYNHEASLYGEFKLGFFFDHSTGLPVIPGSSVKGLLRSVFPNSGKKRDKNKEAFIRSLLVNELKLQNADDIDIDALEYSVFEGKSVTGIDKNEKNIYTAITSMYHRDIFYDAYIQSPGKDGKIMDNDYITPHLNRTNPELSPFTNPNPIQFVKILPGVTFNFQFSLKPSVIEGIEISVEQKKILFSYILLAFGIGAKTNVGYGQFMDSASTNNNQGDVKGKATPPSTENNFTFAQSGKRPVKGIIEKIDSGKALIKIIFTDMRMEKIPLVGIKNIEPEKIGKYVLVSLNLQGKGSNLKIGDASFKNWL